MMRRIFSLILCLILVIAMASGAAAAREELLIRSVQIDGDMLSVLCAASEPGGSWELTLDGTALELQQSCLAQEQLSTTVFCLVDTSGSISDFKYQLMTETMLNISEALGEEDSMVIATVDNTLTIGEPLTTAGERQNAILSIQSSHKDTNLYSGIVQSLEQLAADQRYGVCRCLVILSDGADFQDNGMTQQEVLDAVRGARLPVYTVGLVEKASEREAAKVLGSFARSSAGGIHLTTVSEGSSKPIRTDVDGSQFGRAIMESINGSVILRASLSGLALPSDAATVRLELTYRAENLVLEDYVDLSAKDLPQPAVPNEEPTAPTETEPGPTEPPEPPEPPVLDFPWKWVIIGLSALVLVILCLILLRRKKAPEPVRNVSEEDAPAPEATVSDVPEQLLSEIEEPASAPLFEVEFVSIPYGEVKVSHLLRAEELTTFGRNSKAARVLCPTDKQLSGIHFSLVIRDEGWLVRDEQSVNGTFLNGVSIAQRGWVKLRHHDKLRAGAYEYRIVLKENSEITEKGENTL